MRIEQLECGPTAEGGPVRELGDVHWFAISGPFGRIRLTETALGTLELQADDTLVTQFKSGSLVEIEQVDSMERRMKDKHGG